MPDFDDSYEFAHYLYHNPGGDNNHDGDVHHHHTAAGHVIVCPDDDCYVEYLTAVYGYETPDDHADLDFGDADHDHDRTPEDGTDPGGGGWAIRRVDAWLRPGRFGRGEADRVADREA